MRRTKSCTKRPSARSVKASATSSTWSTPRPSTVDGAEHVGAGRRARRRAGGRVDRERETGVLVAGGERGGHEESGGDGEATKHRMLRDAKTPQGVRRGDGWLRDA